MFFFKSNSRAFRRGFSDGMSAACRFASGERARFSYSPHATDAQAWQLVGDLLNQSYRETGAEIVKTPGKIPAKRKKQSA